MSGKDGLAFHCRHCGKPITEAQFSKAVMVRVVDRCHRGQPIYHGEGPFHAKCASLYQEKAANQQEEG